MKYIEEIIAMGFKVSAYKLGNDMFCVRVNAVNRIDGYSTGASLFYREGPHLNQLLEKARNAVMNANV